MNSEVSVGCDLVAVSEITESISAFGERYLNRIYTDLERSSCAGAAEHQRLAGRFAAKEAAAKVLRPNDDPLPWNSIEVVRLPDGSTELRFHGPSAELAIRRGIRETSVSISHVADFAMAVVVATHRDA